MRAVADMTERGDKHDTEGQGLAQDHDFRSVMLAELPSLRAFAISLCRNVSYADDLVQETILRAWNHRDSFAPGTNMKAWLFTILRNAYRSELRKRRREVEDVDEAYTNQLNAAPEQNGKIELSELSTALQKLPDDQREAILLVGASGLSYEETAKICGCAIGTVKSRVNRARRRLAELLNITKSNELGPAPEVLAVVSDPASSNS